LISILFFSACGPALQADPDQLTIQRSPTVTELSAETQFITPEAQINPIEPPFEVRLSAVRSGATVLRGEIKIPVGQAQAANLQVDDGIELAKPAGQNEQVYIILDFANDLEVELFSNTTVFLNEVNPGADGSSDVILVWIEAICSCIPMIEQIRGSPCRLSMQP